jgi:hypothetical protein
MNFDERGAGLASWWMTLDGIGGSFPALAGPDSATIYAAEIPTIDERPGTTVWLTYDDVATSRVQEWSRHGELRREYGVEPVRELRTGLPFDRRAGLLAPAGEAPSQPRIPTFLVALGAGEDSGGAHVYVCSRIRESGMLFSRIWAGDAARMGVVPLVSRACEEQPQLLHRFTDEGAQCLRFEDEDEIELKFTIRDQTQPWVIADALARAVQSREIKGFIPDLGNEMQRWSYEQHTFEVVSPARHRGYIAFMAMSDGSTAVKFKFFDHDSIRRYERCILDVRLEPTEFRSYISSAIGDADLRELPYLRRTRFDVNVESATTGHFFGLEADEVQSGGQVMRQLEIEYHRSRACYGVHAASIEPELARLADQVDRLLRRWEIFAERGYLSKLSFLKRVAQAEPDDQAAPACRIVSA